MPGDKTALAITVHQNCITHSNRWFSPIEIRTCIPLLAFDKSGSRDRHRYLPVLWIITQHEHHLVTDVDGETRKTWAALQARAESRKGSLMRWSARQILYQWE